MFDCDGVSRPFLRWSGNSGSALQNASNCVCIIHKEEDRSMAEERPKQEKSANDRVHFDRWYIQFHTGQKERLQDANTLSNPPWRRASPSRDTFRD